MRIARVHGLRVVGVPLLILAMRANPSAAQASAGELAAIDRWVAATAIPLRSLELAADLGELGPVASIVGSASVVALGESTHGAHEPLALRNRLFRYLVEALGFSAIAVETGLPESRDIARFVAGGPGAPPIGDAARVARERFTWGFGNFAENVELLRWMRGYNDDPRHRRKIRFYGIDLSLGGPQGSTPTPAAIDAALTYLARVDEPNARRLRARFAPLLRHLPGHPTGVMSAAEHDLLTSAIEALHERLARQRAASLDTSSADEQGWALRAAVVARQGDRVHRVQARAAPGGRIPPSAWREIAARDSAMADNVSWVLEREGDAGRVFVFAHDLHVKNAPTVGGPWQLDRPPMAMGQFLRAALGDRVVLIGMASGDRGTGEAPTDVHATLARARLPRLILDLRRSGTPSEAAAWLARVHGLRVNGDASIRLVPGTAFDALVYLDAVTPARPNRP